MLAFSFFFIALLYATVGFGGGSSYLALLALNNIAFHEIPKIALICNLLVVTGGCWHFYKKGHWEKKVILPLVLSSVPFAFIGGIFPISEKSFLILLGSSLFLAGLRLLFFTSNDFTEEKPPKLKVLIITGALLGLLSGLVGIGGGIFLAPIMLNFKWAKPKVVAATASLFIFCNSISGLFGQILKNQNFDLLNYWMLFVAVILGGQIGSRISTHHKVPQILVQQATAILILFISGKILINLF